MLITEDKKLKKQVEDILDFSEDPETALLKKIEEVNRVLVEMRLLEAKLTALDLRPGKDANPADVVPLVLEQIKPQVNISFTKSLKNASI